MAATDPRTIAKNPARTPSLLALLFVAALVLAYLAWHGGFRDGGAGGGTTGPAIGQKLPHLALEPLTGDAPRVTFNDLTGRVTVLNFWGTWCPPCRREFPHVVALRERLQGRPEFQLWAVSCGQEDDRDLAELRAATESFLRAQPAGLPTYADVGGETRRSLIMGLRLDGFAYPTTLVIDQAGTVRGFWQGYVSGMELEVAALVDSLLANKVDQLPAA